MPLHYADASALLKSVLSEVESTALIDFLRDSDLVSSELVLTEVERAIRRLAWREPSVPVETVLEQAATQLAGVALVPVDRTLLLAAGRLPEPSLRTLDAIHVATALSIEGLDGFVGYDVRQAAAARLAGLRTFSPGA